MKMGGGLNLTNILTYDIIITFIKEMANSRKYSSWDRCLHDYQETTFNVHENLESAENLFSASVKD